MARLAEFRVRSAEAGAAPTPWPDERSLLAAIRAGDRAAAEEMVNRTYAAVFASLYRLCTNSDLAADLTQETYGKAWAALPKFDGRSQLFTWLYRIAYTTFLNHIRRPRRTQSLDEAGAIEAVERSTPVDQLLSDSEQSERLRLAVLRLPDDLRFTITAHFWGGLAVKELAEVEKITTVAIRKRMHRAFVLLEAMLEEDLR